MRALRIAPARQLALVAGRRTRAWRRVWDGLPEQARAEVLVLLARIIARGVLADDGQPPAGLAGRGGPVPDAGGRPGAAVRPARRSPRRTAHGTRMCMCANRRCCRAQVHTEIPCPPVRPAASGRSCWAGPPHQVVVIDEDLGRSGRRPRPAPGSRSLVADVGLGKVGIVLGIEVSRLARNNADWYQLLDLCALTDTLIADADGIYHPGRAITTAWCLGLKGTMSEAELHLIRSRLTAGLRHKAARASCGRACRSGWTTTRTTGWCSHAGRGGARGDRHGVPPVR